MEFNTFGSRQPLLRLKANDLLMEEMQLGKMGGNQPKDQFNQVKWAGDPVYIRQKYLEAQKRENGGEEQLTKLERDIRDSEKEKAAQALIRKDYNEGLEQIEDFKKTFATSRRVPLSNEVGVSLLDNPFLLQNINEEQEQNMNPNLAEGRLKKIQEKELALTKVMARLPINEELYANMLAELKVVAQERAEAERDYMELKLKDNPDALLGESEEEKRRKRIRVSFSSF